MTINYKVLVHTLPEGLKDADKKAYQFFIDSKKPWKINFIDCFNQIWIERQLSHHDKSESWETLKLEPDSFDCVVCEQAYSITLEKT